MKCKQCGFDNIDPIYNAIQFQVQVSVTDEPPKNGAIPVRWACAKCNRFHFRDGSLYDYERAKELAGIV